MLSVPPQQREPYIFQSELAADPDGAAGLKLERCADLNSRLDWQFYPSMAKTLVVRYPRSLHSMSCGISSDHHTTTRPLSDSSTAMR
jgi:hypothetical protein